MTEHMEPQGAAMPHTTQVRRWSVLWVGSVGLLVMGLQPILLGAVFSDGLIGLDGLALAATLEIIALGLSSAISPLWRRRIRARALVLLAAIALLDLLSAKAGSSVPFVFWRMLAGIAEGGLVAMATETIARAQVPEKAGGHFMILQTVAQCILAVAISLFLIPMRGAAGGFEALALVSLASLVLVPFLPDRFAPLRSGGQGQVQALLRRPPHYALGVIFFFFLFIGAVWAFLEPLGLSGGVSSRDVGLMVSLSLAVQVVGAVAGTALAGQRHRVMMTLVASTVAAVLVCAIFALRPGYVLFGLAVMATGFLWLFVTPFQIALTVLADRTHGTALLVPAAQLLGAALGPVLASLFITGNDAGAVPFVGAFMLFGSLILLAAFRRVLAQEEVAAKSKARSPASGWHNWSGSVTAHPKTVIRPRTIDELSGAIRTASGPIRMVGSGHSFTPLVQTDGTMLDLAAFSGLLSHDPETLQARIGAQTRLGDLTPRLAAIGQGLPNMGDIDHQTFAGALATGTHGTGLGLGAYHTQVEAMTLIDGRGELREIRRDGEQDVLHAIGVTLGAFGALTDVTIQNVPAYRLRRRRWIMPLEEAMSGFDRFMAGHRAAEFYVIPFSGKALMITSDASEELPTMRPTEDDEDALATLKLLRSFLLRAPWLRQKIIGTALGRIEPEDYVEDWLNVYASNRVTRFNEMEYHLPYEAGPQALAEITAMTERHFPQVYFPMEIRSVAADEFWLSPFYRRKTCSIAVHSDAREDGSAFMREAEKIFRRHDGRPHWGKIHNLTARDFQSIYPRFRDAMDVRSSFDPDNRFVTPYMRRLLGLD